MPYNTKSAFRLVVGSASGQHGLLPNLSWYGIMNEAAAVLDELLSEVKAKFASSQHQQGVVDSITAFTAAVDWTVSTHS